MEIRDLEYLVAAAKSGNFSRAAVSFGITTSTISRRIGRLEDEFGLTLFERRHSGSHLTAGGEAVTRHIRRALDELEAAKRTGMQSGSGDIGHIRLGVQLPPAGGLLVSFLAYWRAQHPSVELTISEMSDGDLETAVDDRRLDVALALSGSVWPHAAHVPLYRERLLAALPVDHPLAGREAVCWNDLREEIVLVQGWEDCPAARRLFSSWLGERAQFRPQVTSKLSVLGLISAGFGIALATASQAELSFPGVVFAPIQEPDAWIQVDLAWRAELEDAAVGRFVAFLRDQARARSLF